jgi:RHS repeat-associated protein
MRQLIYIFLCLSSTLSYGQLTSYTFQPSGASGYDAVIKSNNPTTAYTTSVSIDASSDGAGKLVRGLLQFDLGSIPSTAIINSAQLTLSGVNHGGTNPSYLRKNTSQWDVSSVTWNKAPVTTTVSQIALSQSTSSTQVYAIDVKDFVQDMVNVPATNFGWTMLLQNETPAGRLSFGSADNSTASLRPKLVINYSLPMNVKGIMAPATGTATADGGMSLIVTNGVPPYSFIWSDASTTKDISGKLPGVYTATVTDNVGSKIKKNLFILPANVPFTFTISPDALSGKDALIQVGDDGTNQDKPGRNSVQFTSQRVSAGVWGKARSLLGIDLSCIPANALISSATLKLYGNGHNPLSRSNESYLYKNTANWDDRTLTWNTQPAHTTTDGVYLAGTTTTNENTFINVTSHVQSWVGDPSSNFGWKIMLADEVTASYSIRTYGSSNHSNPALWPAIEITLALPWLSDTQRNWVMEESYDENGVVIATQKTYLDDLGRPTQGLNQNAAGEVFASQTVYDAYGRPAVQTLPAYHGTALQYNVNFFQDQNGHEYSYTNFDLPGNTANPDVPQSGLATAAPTYYSNANSMDAWQATANLPFSRSRFMANPLDEPKTVNAADNAFNAASGREARSYSMVCGDELRYILGTGNSYKVQLNSGNPMASTSLTLSTGNFIRATKQVVVSPDNKEVVSYSIGNKVLASCMSGLSSPDNCSMSSVKNYMDWYGTQSIDLHIPHSAKSSLLFPLPTYKLGPITHTVTTADVSYVITDQSTEQVLTGGGVDYTLNSSTRVVTFSFNYLAAHAAQPLFLRISYAYSPAFISSFTGLGPAFPAGVVQYDLDYGRWSVNYYDLGGNLRTSVSAKGINCSSPGTVSMATTYDYSHLGQLIAQKSPDEGLKEYIYNLDGQPRYSQNAEQKTGKRFSYVTYDTQNRPVEQGEFSNVTGSGSSGVYFQNYYNNYSPPYSGNTSSNSLVNSNSAFSAVYTNDVTHSSYEELNSSDDIPSAYTYASSYAGQYKNGQLSKTWSKNTDTWYKYDNAGRLAASVQRISDPDFMSQAGSGDAQIKTTDVSYDPYFGQVTNTYYQKHVSSEYAEHRFSYDADKRLGSVSFVAGANSPVLVESLSYDKLGRVSRRELGPGLQGLDYVYTLGNQLKALNHPSLDHTKDRGGDNRSYTGSGSGVYADLFGELLEYYPGDYVRSGTSIEAHSNGNYNGHIYGSRYKTRNDVNGTNTGADYINGLAGTQIIFATNYEQQELANHYAYDDFGQLANSTFGTFNNSTNTFTGRTDYKEYGATANSIGYDENGNITRLKRNAYDVSGSPVLLDDLMYTYASNTNKHTSVNDGATNSFPSAFNFKNQVSGTPATISYNAIGQMTVNADEKVVTITYYPNGQVKFVEFANGNTNSYGYNDQGQKYKAVFFDATATVSKTTWYMGNAIYEYISNVGSFDLKELSVGGAGRVGVYKQDVTGIAIGTGHLEYQISDHLGNVRITFKESSVGGLEPLSMADYYAFGGQLPGRIWQQSGGECRYGYQGQEKSTNDVNWDQFELRLFNHDLGRWSAPDPYGQFHSPYIAMDNNPISMVDPDGGYINMSSAGQAQRQQFLSQLDYDRAMQRGRFSYEWLYPQYQDAIERLRHEYLTMNDLENGGGAEKTGVQFLEALLKLNNDYMGLGLGSEFLSSGTDYVTRSTVQSDYGSGLYKKLQAMNGTTAKMEDMDNSFHNKYFDPFEASTQQWMDNNNARQRDYVNKWQKDKWDRMDAEEAAEKAGQLNEGEQGMGMPLAVATPTNPCEALLKRKNVNNGGGKWKSNESNKKIHFAIGFRFGNVVYFDIRINSNGSSKWEKNFPGRFWLPWNKDHASFRFSLLPYRVFHGQDPQSYYKDVWSHMHVFLGGYGLFTECFDYDYISHKKR